MPFVVSHLPSYSDLNTPPTLSYESGPTIYNVHIKTANLNEAGTDKNVFIRLTGDLGVSKYNLLTNKPHHPDNTLHSFNSSSTTRSLHAVSKSTPSAPAPAHIFCSGTVSDFSFRDIDVGNIINIDLRHVADDDENAAWNPESIAVNNISLQRTWSFLCTSWISAQVGNAITLTPTGVLAVGRRASRRASRRVSDSNSAIYLSPTSTESRRRFEIMRRCFTENSPDDVNSSNVAVGIKRVCFNLKRFSHAHCHMYLTGSVPTLGVRGSLNVHAG